MDLTILAGRLSGNGAWYPLGRAPPDGMLTGMRERPDPHITHGEPWYTGSGGHRDPAVALFDPAAELVAAAGALRSAAARPGSGPGVAATLGCVEGALQALAAAVSEMARELETRREGDRLLVVPSTSVAAVRRRRPFADAVADLERAERSLGRAREQAAALMPDELRARA